MTKQEFLRDFYLHREEIPAGRDLHIFTRAKRRSDQSFVGRLGVTTKIDIPETNDFIVDSNSAISLTRWDDEKIKDQINRGHIDYFVRLVPIDDYYSGEATDLNEMYK